MVPKLLYNGTRMPATRLLLGTANPAKMERLRWLVRGLSLELASAAEADTIGEPPTEQGSSHEEIARRKAEGWSRLWGGLAVASDGGMVVPVLGARWDSLRTHRFAGEEADDRRRVERLLELMGQFTGGDRRVSWTEAVAFAERGRTLVSWQVQGPEGVLLEAPAGPVGVRGFWASSVWYFPRLGKTYDQLSEGELEELGDHWLRLRNLVLDHFLGVGEIPARQVERSGRRDHLGS